MKKIMVLLLIAVLLFTLVACGKKEEKKEPAPTEKKKTTEENAQEPKEEKTFTLEELKKFNGKDGNKAYVAVDGIVYDVTESSLWKDGKHNGFEAGNDLTDAIKKESPHGVSKLEKLPVVGKLAE